MWNHLLYMPTRYRRSFEHLHVRDFVRNVIFRFCDHRYCSEECRDLAIQAASSRRYY